MLWISAQKTQSLARCEKQNPEVIHEERPAGTKWPPSEFHIEPLLDDEAMKMDQTVMAQRQQHHITSLPVTNLQWWLDFKGTETVSSGSIWNDTFILFLQHYDKTKSVRSRVCRPRFTPAGKLGPADASHAF